MEGLAAEVGCVSRREIVPLLRQIVQREDGRYRANRDAGAAVDALHRIDVEHFFRRVGRFVLLRVDTIHGWCRQNGIDAVGLNASSKGLRLYESMGYHATASPMMFLPLK